MLSNKALDVLNCKSLQLEAMVSMLSNIPGHADKLSEAELGNYVWVMSDLVSDMRRALSNGSEVRND